MSIQAINKVWKHSKQSGSKLLVLLAIADYAKDDGAGAYPKLETLASKARYKSIRGLQKTLRGLVEAGELVVHEQKGPHGVNFYDIIYQDGSNEEAIIANCKAYKTTLPSLDEGSKEADRDEPQFTPPLNHSSPPPEPQFTPPTGDPQFTQKQETSTKTSTEGGELKNSPAAPAEISFDDLQSASSHNEQNGHYDSGRSGKPLTEMDRGEAERYLMFEAGRTPGAESDPAIERSEKEYQRSGWEIRSEAIQEAAIYFAAATGYQIPSNTGERNLWIKALKVHVDEVPLHELYRLYQQTFTDMTAGNNPLTVYNPNSLTKTLIANWQQKKSRKANDDPMSFYLKIRGNYPSERFAIMAVQDRFQLENWEPVR